MLLTAAFLTITTAANARQPAPPAQIPLTRNEIALLATLTSPPRQDTQHRMRWSRWQRHHQPRTRHRHYQRQSMRL